MLHAPWSRNQRNSRLLGPIAANHQEIKDLTIAKLMSITPTGTADPSPFLYDSTMYAMAGIMAVAAISHAAIGDVNRKHLE